MKSFSEIVNTQILNNEQDTGDLKEINEVNILKWFGNFLDRTSSFLEIWLKKGGKKYRIDETKGKIQATKKEIKVNINQLRKTWSNDKIYKKCYPKTTNFIANQQANIRPDDIDKKDWDNLAIKMIVYTPEINYAGENYPCAVGIYPQKKIELLDGYFHIESFEASTMIQNKEIINRIFEIFVDEIRKSKGSSYNGLTVVSMSPANYSRYTYHGKHFETAEIENKENEEKKKEEDDPDNLVDDDISTTTILKLDF